MLERPPISDDAIAACLAERYGLQVDTLTFLPRGFDVDAAAFRARLTAGDDVFVKVRRDDWPRAALRVPRHLRDQGNVAVVAPLAARDGSLLAAVDDYSLALYPFIDAHSGATSSLNSAHWQALGEAARAIHDSVLPDDLAREMQREAFSPRWRERTRELDAMTWPAVGDAIAARLADVWRANRTVIRRVVDHSDALAQRLRGRDLAFVPCHTDLHGDNLLLEPAGGVHIVDWDDVMLAPKERDLMYIGSGIAADRPTGDESTWFYRGYGPTHVDPVALAYYRCEHLVVDIAEIADMILAPPAGDGASGDGDRARGLGFFEAWFRPGYDADIALRTAEM